MVPFPGFAFPPYGFRREYPGSTGMGFPIRKSPDQSLFSDSPGLNAACHVLHRLPAPRHPLCALNYLTIKFSQVEKCRMFDCQRTMKIYAHPPTGGELRLENSAEKNGGADRDRTGDLRLAKPALSRLSYSPAFRARDRSPRGAVDSSSSPGRNKNGGPKWT
jgi:hypothetical protein